MKDTSIKSQGMEIQEILVWFTVELLVTVQTFIFSIARENSSATK